MITSRTGLFLTTLSLFSFGLLGCSSGVDGNFVRDNDQEGSGAIVGGTLANKYEESVLINMMNYGQISAACSGSVIAPNVVLTAGHCVHGFDGWEIIAPFANGQTAMSKKADTYDWNDDSGSVNPDQHDVGLIILDSEITLSQYPSIADKPVNFGSNVVDIGRIDNGYFSESELFVSKPHPVFSGSEIGYPYSYGSDEIIQSGDSGGPVEIPGASPHVIVAVNSGAGGGTEILARVDLVFDWIQKTVQSGGADITPDDPNDGGDPNDPNNDPLDPNDPNVDPNDPGADPGGDCGDIGYEGVCTDDGSVLWCEEGQLYQMNCLEMGSWCVTLPWDNWSDCL